MVAVNQQKIEALAKNKDLKITLVVPDSWNAPLRVTPLEKKSDDNYEIISLKVSNNGYNDKFLFPTYSLFQLIRRVDPDIIHVEEEPWSLSLFQLSVISKILKKKIIFFTWENIRRKHSAARSFVEGVNLNTASGAIAGNKEAKHILEDKGFKKPTFVLPQLGVDTDFFKKKKEKRKKFTIGFIGRLEEQKGIRTLLQAVKELNFDFSLMLIGSGPMKEEIDNLVKENGLFDKVEIIQGVNHGQIPEYLNRMDVLVLPSITTNVWKEQFGHVLIEAMSAEVHVIGSSSGAIPEVVGDAGIIFQEGAFKELAEGLESLKKDKKLQEELSRKGEARVKELFTQDKIAEQTFKFYKQILGVL